MQRDALSKKEQDFAGHKLKHLCVDRHLNHWPDFPFKCTVMSASSSAVAPMGTGSRIGTRNVHTNQWYTLCGTEKTGLAFVVLLKSSVRQLYVDKGL